MRIATWNINGLRARQPFLVNWLADRQPDIVGLQELKISDPEFPRAVFHDVGYHVVIHGQKGWNGVAVLSRQPLRLSQVGLPGQEALGARLIAAELDRLVFITAYVPNGKSLTHEDFPRKLAWLDGFVRYLEDCVNRVRPVIVCGDFNLCPTPLDSWNEELLHGQLFHTDEERARFRRLLGIGFVDLYRHQFPANRAFSWWDYRGGAFHKQQGLRIDFLLATPDIVAGLENVTIDREYRKKKDGLTPSDHAPVFADLAASV
ncbi:MAG: exodeoxyribonuclease III [Gammaproteobacteria bacterium]